jgi:hypothetical protein
MNSSDGEITDQNYLSDISDEEDYEVIKLTREIERRKLELELLNDLGE